MSETAQSTVFVDRKNWPSGPWDNEPDRVEFEHAGGGAMKALTLWRPWPWAIFHAPAEVAKRIENRPWRPWSSIIGKTIAIHAGRHFDSDGAEDICSIVGRHPDGTPPPRWDDEGIIGTARVLTWVAAPALLIPGQNRWWSGPFAWVLDDVRSLQEPIPCKGHQGLWDLPLEIELEIGRRAA